MGLFQNCGALLLVYISVSGIKVAHSCALSNDFQSSDLVGQGRLDMFRRHRTPIFDSCLRNLESVSIGLEEEEKEKGKREQE